MTTYETRIRELLAGNNEDVIKFFRQKQLLKSKIRCTTCNKKMKVIR
jgi:hypothetical protein